MWNWNGNLNLQQDLNRRHGAAKSDESISSTLKGTEASFENARWCKQYVKSYLRILVFMLYNFVYGENCDLDTTGVRKK